MRLCSDLVVSRAEVLVLLVVGLRSAEREQVEEAQGDRGCRALWLISWTSGIFDMAFGEHSSIKNCWLWLLERQEIDAFAGWRALKIAE